MIARQPFGQRAFFAFLARKASAGEIWQGKVPAGLIVKRRNAEIQDFAKKNSLAWPSDRTIRRYFNA